MPSRSWNPFNWLFNFIFKDVIADPDMADPRIINNQVKALYQHLSELQLNPGGYIEGQTKEGRQYNINDSIVIAKVARGAPQGRYDFLQSGEVTSMTHYKSKKMPKHEYLVFTVEDNLFVQPRLFVLERQSKAKQSDANDSSAPEDSTPLPGGGKPRMLPRVSSSSFGSKGADDYIEAPSPERLRKLEKAYKLCTLTFQPGDRPRFLEVVAAAYTLTKRVPAYDLQYMCYWYSLCIFLLFQDRHSSTAKCTPHDQFKRRSRCGGYYWVTSDLRYVAGPEDAGQYKQEYADDARLCKEGLKSAPIPNSKDLPSKTEERLKSFTRAFEGQLARMDEKMKAVIQQDQDKDAQLKAEKAQQDAKMAQLKAENAQLQAELRALKVAPGTVVASSSTST